MFRYILHPDRVAQIGFVAAIPFQTVAVGDLGPVGVGFLARREFLKYPLDNRLHGGKNIVLFNKAHLDIKLIEIRRRSVRPWVFITKTRCDLEIAVKARHHDQLFELLWCLGQRIKLARMQAARHQKITGTFGAAGGDDRGLKFVEPLIPHPVAD